MKTEFNPQDTNRAEAFELWMSSPMPIVMWRKYRKHWFKTILPISFQFHHVQMDGTHAGRFLANLQNEINRLQIYIMT